MNPPIEINMDASSLPYTACEQAYVWRILEGYAPIEDAEHFTFGSAVHVFLQQRALGNPAAVAMAIAGYKGTELAKLGMALGLAEQYPIPQPLQDLAGQPLVEYKFRQLFREYNIDGTDVRIFVCGTMDLVHQTDKNIVIDDYKTTSLWDAKKYMLACRRTVQNLFYQWFLYKYGAYVLPLHAYNKAHAGAIYTRIIAFFLSRKPMAYDIADRITFDKAELDNFEYLLDGAAQRAARLVTRPPVKDGIVRGACYRCDFQQVCLLGPQMLEANYKKSEYNPLKFR